MSRKITDGWYGIPGDGLNPNPNYRVSGWGGAARDEHICYVQNNKVVAANALGSRSGRMGIKDIPTIDEQNYLAVCEKRWLVSVDKLLKLTSETVNEEMGWGQVLGGTATTLLGLTIIKGLLGKSKSKIAKQTKAAESLITLDDHVEVKR